MLKCYSRGDNQCPKWMMLKNLKTVLKRNNSGGDEVLEDAFPTSVNDQVTD